MCDTRRCSRFEITGYFYTSEHGSIKKTQSQEVIGDIYIYKGGECVQNYELLIVELEDKVAPIGFSQGGQ